MSTTWTGNAHVYGDNVDTDVLYPGRYLHLTETEEMAAHAAEDLDPQFVARAQPGDVFIAGRNLGCGSSREQAAVALKACGIRAVVCESAARIFFRNAINSGLPVLRVGPTGMEQLRPHIQHGTPITIDLALGSITVDRGSTEPPLTITAQPLPPTLQAIILDGGLLPHLRKRLQARTEAVA